MAGDAQRVDEAAAGLKGQRVFYLDFIRAISILLIIFFHYNVWTGRIISDKFVFFKYYNFAGTVGVSLFFILSGASLMLSTHKKIGLMTFYKKRFLTIFPLFYFTYVLFVLIYAVLPQQAPFGGSKPATFILTIIGLDGFLVYKIPNYYLIGEWFLGCIIVLYLMYPLVRYFFNKNKHLFLLVSFFIWLFIYNIYSWGMPIERFPLFRIIEFIFGMYFVSLYRKEGVRSNVVLLSSAVAGLIVLLRFDLYGSIIFGNIVLGILLFVIFVPLSVFSEKLLPVNVINYISKYSYAAFLLHHPILKGMLLHFRNSISSRFENIVLFALTLAIIFFMSFFTHNTVKHIISRPNEAKS